MSHTNPSARGLKSIVMLVCTGSVTGVGSYGYDLALLSVVQQARSKNT